METDRGEIKSLRELLEQNALTPDELAEYLQLIADSRRLASHWKSGRFMWALKASEDAKGAAKEMVADLRVLRR